MVDSAYSQADWSVNPSSLATASYASASPSQPGPRAADLERDNSATLAALDSMYTALSSLGFQQVRAVPLAALCTALVGFLGGRCCQLLL